MNTLKFNQIEFNHIGEQPTSSVKLQEKSITVTENGTTLIVPDSGYALEKVEVKVDTPVANRYYHVELDADDTDLDNFCFWRSFYSSIKIMDTTTNKILIMDVNRNFTIGDMPNIIGFSINCDIIIGNLTDGTILSSELILENLPPFTRTEITKEEYYSLI